MKWHIRFDAGDYASWHIDVIGEKLERVIRGDFTMGVIVDGVEIQLPGYIEDITVVDEQ